MDVNPDKCGFLTRCSNLVKFIGHAEMPLRAVERMSARPMEGKRVYRPRHHALQGPGRPVGVLDECQHISTAHQPQFAAMPPGVLLRGRLSPNPLPAERQHTQAAQGRHLLGAAWAVYPSAVTEQSFLRRRGKRCLSAEEIREKPASRHPDRRSKIKNIAIFTETKLP